MELETREEEASTDSFREIGAELAQARLERGMQIQELSQLLRISRHHLKNIEAGEFDLLPGSTYVSGYLRTYARELGLDPVALPQRYRALHEKSQEKPSYSFPVDRQQPQRSGAMMASIMVIFAVGGYGGWYAAGKPDIMAAFVGDAPQEVAVVQQVENAVTESDILIARDGEQPDPAMPEVVAEVAAEVAGAEEVVSLPPVVAQDESVGAQTTLPQTDLAGSEVPAAETMLPDTETAVAALAETGVSTLSDSAPVSASQAPLAELPDTMPATVVTDELASTASPAVVAPDVDSDDSMAASDEVTTQLADSGAETSASEGTVSEQVEDSLATAGVAYARQRVPEMEITVRATGISWVEIIRNDGEEVMTKLMRDGETYVVDSRDKLYLSTGNAGGIELLFHDGMVQSVGESGEILRDLPLDAGRLRNQL